MNMDPDAPRAFFEETLAAFNRAAGARGTVEKTFSLLGQVVRMRFAGPAMLPLLFPAFEHLAADSDGAPDLTVCVWDGASTGTQLPPPPWTTGNPYTPRGDIYGLNDDRFRAAYHIGAGVLNLLDVERRTAIYCTHDARRLPSYEIGAPLRTILHWWMRRFDWQYIHGAVVGRGGAGVLLAGKGGTGKSTTALACLDAGMLYVGDDYCLVRTGPAPRAHTLYNTAKLKPDSLRWFPHLRAAVSNAERMETEKAIFFMHRHWPEKLTPELGLRAILLPRITGGAKTSLAPANPMQAVQALAMSTMHQLAGADAATLKSIERLAQSLPCYRLDLGTELSAIPETISPLLD
jgi:hypothetical protein